MQDLQFLQELAKNTENRYTIDSYTKTSLIPMFTDKNIIGLDIGTESIKLVEITHTEGKNELLTYGIAKHDIELDGYWDSNRLRKLSIIIEDILETGNFKGVKTVMSIQSKDVYVTTMDFEEGWDKKLIQTEIDKQAPYFLPYPPDEMRLSWNLINDDERVVAYTGKQRVIINALPDFVIENSKNLLEHLNLDGAALENQTRSQIRSVLAPDTGNTVLVDIGDKFTTLSIVIEGVLRSSMHVNFGAQKIVQDLSLALGIDEESANNFKKDLGLVNLYQLPPQLLDTLTTLKNEITTFVDLNKKIAQNPDKIILTGGAAHTPGLYEYFREYEVPVFMGNSIRNVAIAPALLPYVGPISNQLSTAIGLALRDDV
jgi:type IV pilus assembly protein PilM